MVPLSALVIVLVQLWHSKPAYAQYYCGDNCIPCCPDAQEFVTAPEATAFNQQHTVCAWATQYIQFPASASNFGQCGTLTTCVLGSNFQTTAPTHTSDRVCNIVTQCTQGISFQTPHQHSRQTKSAAPSLHASWVSTTRASRPR
jgi:hypothetical protein